MKTLEFELSTTETMWYPACGNDLRPLHHVAFNNIYIDPRWIIMNDVIAELDLSPIQSINGITVHSRINREIDGVRIQLIKLILQVNGRRKMKNIIYIPLPNIETYELLVGKKIHPRTAMLHRVNDAYRGMNISWIEAFKALQVKYCYTDNWFNLSFENTEEIHSDLIKKNVRYISKQTYHGFQYSNPKLLLNSQLLLNNGFDSTIHLFEFCHKN